MTTDLYSTVLFQDGEQFTFADANNMQRFVRAQLSDQILQQSIGAVSNAATRPEFGGDDGNNVPTLWAYCASPGRAFLRQGSANNKIQIAPGTLLQKLANDDGNDSTLVSFTFDGTSAGEFTIASGDATNPRVDLLQMKLEYISDTPATVDFQDATTRANTSTPSTPTRRRIRCTLSVKAGTPAASPTIPDPDAGCVPVGTAVVGHGWTSAGAAPIFGVDAPEANNVVIHDQRMPLGIEACRIDPVLYKLSAAWSLANVNTNVTSSSGTNKMFATCYSQPRRLVGVDIRLLVNGLTAGAATLGTLFGSTSDPGSIYQKCNGFGTNTVLSGSIARSRRIDFESLHVPVTGPTIQSSTVNKIGVPLWTSGFRVPQGGNIIPALGDGTPRTGWAALGVINQATASTFGEIIFYLAG